MLKTGSGAIVNTASILGQVGFGGSCAYVAAKHGVIGLTKADRECYDFLVKKHPMGRLGKIEEIVDLVLWLSSDKASFCNGSYFTVDGGYVAK